MSDEIPHWTDVLPLRAEVVGTDGSVGELQMSLHKAVYQTVDVPYRKPEYYVDITEPTPALVGFFARIARRLGTDHESTALFHLDQGMGGGKSHALVGLHHMASSPDKFFASDLGREVVVEAEQGGLELDVRGTQSVILTADYFSPGKKNEIFGPATTLFERFLWSLTEGDMDRYKRLVAGGPNKSTLQEALVAANRPVLILLDELMDYVLQLSDGTEVHGMPNEKAFLNALMDACDDVPRVAFVVVMIRSELDERGYPPIAEDFRDYVTARLVRNGTTVAVTEAQDFSSIIKRRLFETPTREIPSSQLASSFLGGAVGAWQEQVFDKLGANRGRAGFADRVHATYPFHPELMRLVQEEWSQVQAFQRVRSTVAIFARTALYWQAQHAKGRWTPTLIGVGDIPLTTALEQVLSSGLLMGNDRAIQGFRSVASTDVTTLDGTGGRAVAVDERLSAEVATGQPSPAVRMATALFCYSLVARPRAGRGATRAEILAAVFDPQPAPGTEFTGAEEVFNALTNEDGLGALEVTNPSNAQARYYLSIKQTLRMYFTSSRALVTVNEKDRLIWEVAQKLARKGPFEEIRFIDGEDSDGKLDLQRAFEGVDAAETVLVVLDPRRWTLLNGKDASSREDIAAAFGLGETPLRVNHSASMVIACVNTHRRDVARKRAEEFLAWRHVVRQINPDEEDELAEAQLKREDAEKRLKQEMLRAYQHFAYLIRARNLDVDFRRFDDDNKSALHGDQVWAELVTSGRAAASGGLSSNYLATLLDLFDRDLTLKEITQSFYSHPAFPMVATVDEVRRAVFGLINADWELVGSHGEVLSVGSPDQLAINSITQQVRKRVVSTGASSGEGDDASVPASPGPNGHNTTQTRSTTAAFGESTQTGVIPEHASGVEAAVYRRYSVELRNRSIVDPQMRDRVWQFLRELSKIIDTANSADHQLIDLTVTLTTAEGNEGAVMTKAAELDARTRVEVDDF
ncbi:DUF499 domain-containing protein [Microbacterium sp. NPDC058062]|uniref:DUF499 domain-containing protein n=1 Tax=Microbacterium sp. NPDC058062 TaxID=3346320 RepID=UPI0036DAC166